MKWVNCNGNHTAATASKSCPRYQKGMLVLKIKNEKKLTPKPQSSTLSEQAGQLLMLMLFNLTAIIFILMYFLLCFLITPYRRTTLLRIETEQCIWAQHSAHVTRKNEIQTQVVNKVNFSSNFVFGNPIFSGLFNRGYKPYNYSYKSWQKLNILVK